MKLLYVLLYVTLFGLINARPDRSNFKQQKATCGYESCHPTSNDLLNVHLVPHSHDDVGWLKTLDQYYYGSRTSTQRAGVQYILDSVVDELLKDPKRRFVYVESAFFEKWWLEQDEERREDVKQLVNEGRLEFAGGAWSMNDEASVHYHSIVDQLTWGLRFLNDTFGECGRPRAGWQIDPFGHSRELANLWAVAGFDGLLLVRIDHQDKKRRTSEKECEMIWRGSDDIGAPSDLLTGVLFNHYSPPPGFCFDVLCSDDPIIDDVNSPDYNVDQMVEKFLEFVKNQADSYKTNNIILTMGDDFYYQNALMWYKNMDKLIKYVNERHNEVKLIYSTPSCYIKSLHDSNTTWPTKQDDFFPYGSDSHSFWTGYFTSRPTLKYYERRGNNMLQACKQLQSMTNPSDESGLRSLRSAMGVMQHHDAITGTEKQHVAYDYARILEAGIQDCLKVSQNAINKLMATSEEISMQLCKLNETECSISENSNSYILTFYNPLGYEVSDIVRIPSIGKIASIRNATGALLEHWIQPLTDDLKNRKKIIKSNATHELIFEVKNIPALGFKSYYIDNKGLSNDDDGVQKTEQSYESRDIENEFIKVNLDSNTGLVSSISFTDNGVTTDFPLSQEMLYYEGADKSGERASGAYVFRPKTEDPISFNRPVNRFLTSDIVSEVHQHFSNWTTQIIRTYRGQKHVEIEWTVGPIPIEDKTGKEVITRFSTDFKTDSSFYTDSSGRQMLKRILNKRPTWEVELDEPVSGNYYPVVSMMSIKDNASKRELYLITDRAQGGSSLKDGQLELMVHRRLLKDDGFGVGEALDESENGIGLVARGTHYLVIGNSDQETPPLIYSRQLALKKLLQPIILISDAEKIPFSQWINNNNVYGGIIAKLPDNVHLLTLEPWKEGSILLRLEHYFQKTDDPNNLSKSVTVDLEEFLSGFTISSIKEVTLPANQFSNEAKRLNWKSSEIIAENFNEIYNKQCSSNRNSVNYCMLDSKRAFTHMIRNQSSNIDSRNTKEIRITLNAMEIKSFVIEAVPKHL
ncbi:lysosomal alpha-mannosidase-like [Arctopsyche grandis]|uniref:lysosomal alpha-mannosidase-like n=1 Tax=Arctopsyche grandis TaxID=121162 RepID=UPI00406DA129